MANQSPYHHLYTSTRWKRRRAEQLRRDPLCRMCTQLGRTTAACIADHVKPHRGDEAKFFEGQLQSLCKACHDRHKQGQEAGGLLKGCDANGLPLDGLHHWRA